MKFVKKNIKNSEQNIGLYKTKDLLRDTRLLFFTLRTTSAYFTRH